MKLTRIREFTVIATDAWHRIFLYTELEEGLDKCCLCVAHENERDSIPLDNETLFIRQIEDTGILNVNNRKYYEHTEDGYYVLIHLIYDDKEVLVSGSNALPDEAINILNLIGDKWKHNSNSERKRLRFHKITDKERAEIICYPKDRARLLVDLWDE